MVRSFSPTCVALCAALVLAPAPTPTQAVQIIDTVAGGGPNNMPALSANLGIPQTVVADATGNLFIASGRSNRVFKIDTAGLLTVVAGNGTFGFSGDGGPATSASLNSPSGLALDANGNLFIANAGNFSIGDTANQRIRRVDAATGIISTVAGNGLWGFRGDGGPATEANLRFPAGLDLDAAGNLLIADRANQRIRRVDAATGIISTVAGNGTQGFSGDGGLATGASLNNPRDVAVDAAGNLFIADTSNKRVRRVDAATGIISTVAGNGVWGFSGDGGPASNANLGFPVGVALHPSGNLFIVDFNNHRIRLVDAATGVISTVAGNGNLGFSGDGGSATSASLGLPLGVDVDSGGNLFIADTNNSLIRHVDADTGIISTVAGNGDSNFSGDSGPATSASLWFPEGVALDVFGNLFIAERFNHRIRRVDAVTGLISTVAGNGNSGFGGDGGPATSASLRNPGGVTFDAAGNLFIADTLNRRIRRVDAATGVISTAAGNGIPGFSGDSGPATSASLSSPGGVAFDAAGNLFIADWGNRRIRRVDAVTGIISTVAGNGGAGFNGDGGPATSASLRARAGLAIDAAGNLFIPDDGNNRIRRVDAVTGLISTVAGNGNAGFTGDGGRATSASLNQPGGVTLDAAGNLFIADFGNHRIRRVGAATGLIFTVAGDGDASFLGDGGLATSASLRFPSGVVLDDAGNLYIADRNNHRIRRVLLATQVPVADLVFDPPLLANSFPSIHQHRMGSIIPVRFHLTRDATSVGAVVATISVVKIIDIATETLDTTDLTDDAGNANGNSKLFRHNPITGQYLFNLSTKGFPAPATFRIFVTLDDGSQKSVDFSLRE